jgi:hypothetical protein
MEMSKDFFIFKWWVPKPGTWGEPQRARYTGNCVSVSLVSGITPSRPRAMVPTLGMLKFFTLNILSLDTAGRRCGSLVHTSLREYPKSWRRGGET